MTKARKCGGCGAELPAHAPEGLCPRCLLKEGMQSDETGAQSDGRRGSMDRDRNLLFGVLAVQLRKVTPSQLVDVAGAWATDPSRDLSRRLVEAGVLTDKDRDFVDNFVDQAIHAHGGDAKATLATFGGDEQVYHTYRGTIVRTESGEVHSTPGRLTAAEVEIPDKIPAVHEVPGRYSQLGQHAHGGMGRILLVHDEYLGREIALKELLPPSALEVSGGALSPVRQSVPMMARFLQEARITGQLEHPAIVPVYELGYRKDGTLYYTMKLVRGTTLAEALRDTTTLRERLALLPHFVDLCQAMAYAHSRRVLHRDLKPSNVMVGEFGETVVIDWGLAKVKDQRDVHADGFDKTVRAMHLEHEVDLAKTSYGHALGTPAYMPPEQAKGQLEQVNERSDVYSLGAILYELLTGQAPFSGKTAQEIIMYVIDKTPEPIATAQPEAPRELAAICEKAMQKDPANRYETAQELAAEVQRFQAGALVQAYTYGFSEHLRRFARRYRTVLTTAAGAALVLITVGIYSYIRIYDERNDALVAREEAIVARDEAVVAQNEAVTATENAEIQEYYRTIALAQAKVESGDYGDVPDMLGRCPEHLRGWEWGYLMGQCHLEEKSVQAHDGPITAFVSSPDGSLLATAGEDGYTILWDGKTFAEKWRFADAVPATALALDPMNRYLVAARDGLRVLDCQTGSLILDTMPPRYNSDHMQEFAMSMRVTGAPKQGAAGRIHFYKPNEYGGAGFLFSNGDQVIRLNLRQSQRPTHGSYTGPIRYYRVVLPADPVSFDEYRDMRVEIDWIAITDDPTFTPDRNQVQEDSDAVFPSGLIDHAIWTFDEDNEHWVTAKNGAAVVSHANGKLIISYQPGTGTEFQPSMRYLPSEEWDPVDALVFHPDGTRLYVLVDGQVREFNVSDWSECRAIPLTDRPGGALAISQDGIQLAVACRLREAEGFIDEVWKFDAATYEPYWHFRTEPQSLVKKGGLHFDPTSQHLLCLFEPRIELRNLSDGRLERDWRVDVISTGSATGCSKITWQDDTSFFVGDRGGAIVLYHIDNGYKETVLHTGTGISGLIALPGHGRTVTVDRVGVMKSWLLEAAWQMGGAVQLRAPELASGTSPGFSPDGEFLVALDVGGGPTVWDTSTLEPLRFPKTGSFLGFCPGSGEVAFSINDGQTISFFHFPDGTKTRETPVPSGFSWTSFAIDGTGKYMALVEDKWPPQSPALIEIATGRTVPAEFPAAPSTVLFSPDGQRLAVGRTREGRVDIWTVPDCRLYGELSHPVEGSMHTRGICSMAFHPLEEVIAAVNGTGRLLIWDYGSGELLQAIQAHEYGESSLCFSPNGERLVSGGDDGYVHVWDWRTGQNVLTFRNDCGVSGIAFSPDGSMLACGGSDPPVSVRIAWPRSGELLPEIQRRRVCHARLLKLGEAKVAWAEAKGRNAENLTPSASDIRPYLGESGVALTCPSGGTYSLRAVGQLPECSEHGTPISGYGQSKE